MRSLIGQALTPLAVAFIVWLILSPFASTTTATLLALLCGVAVALAVGYLQHRSAAFIDTYLRHDWSSGVPIPLLGDGELIDNVQRVGRSMQTAQERQQALLGQLAQQALVLDRMNDGLLRVDRNAVVTYANVAAGTLFGGRNPVGRSVLTVTRDHELGAAVQRCLLTMQEQQHTFDLPGENRLISATIAPLTTRTREVLVLFHDITEVSRLQSLRRDFVANVSHELRTPLSTIKVLTETLIMSNEPDPDGPNTTPPAAISEASRAETLDFLHKIDLEVDAMTALVRDLLEITRLESTGGRVALRDIDALAMARDVADRMRPMATRQDVRIAMEPDDEPDPVPSAATGIDEDTLDVPPLPLLPPPAARADLVGDERRLHQALLNLVSNAVAHTPAGGLVIIRVVMTPQEVTFEVEDTGSGIPARDLPRVWERFYKTDRARTGPGTGLGLAIVKHVVQAHGGSVAATSVVGEGSTFSFTIPRGQITTSGSTSRQAPSTINDGLFIPN